MPTIHKCHFPSLPSLSLHARAPLSRLLHAALSPNHSPPPRCSRTGVPCAWVLPVRPLQTDRYFLHVLGLSTLLIDFSNYRILIIYSP